MNKFNLDDYEPVEDRIRRFYKDHPDGRIYTELASPSDKPETAIFKASVYIGDVHVSDGWALEKDGDGYVNKTSHLENCETSAIGRALANYNYQGTKRPSREEVAKTQAQMHPKNATEGQNLASGAIFTEKAGKDTAEIKKLLQEFVFMSDPLFNSDEREQVKHSLSLAKDGPTAAQDIASILKSWRAIYEDRKAKVPEPGLVF